MAQRTLLEVDPFHGVGRSHDTAVIITVGQVHGVPYFMNRFLYYAIAKEFMIGWKTIELLPQPMCREQGAGTTHLRFAENKSENRNIKIDGRNAQHSPGIGGYELLHAMEDFRGVILLPLPVKGELRVETDRKYSAWRAKKFLDGRRKILQQRILHIPDRQQVQELHRMPSSSDFIGLRWIRFLVAIRRRAAPAVFLQLVIQRDSIDVEHIRCMALIASALLNHT